MSKVQRQTYKFIKLEDDKWQGKKMTEKRNAPPDVKKPVENPSYKPDTRRFDRVQRYFIPRVKSVEQYIPNP